MSSPDPWVGEDYMGPLGNGGAGNPSWARSDAVNGGVWPDQTATVLPFHMANMAPPRIQCEGSGNLRAITRYWR